MIKNKGNYYLLESKEFSIRLNKDPFYLLVVINEVNKKNIIESYNYLVAMFEAFEKGESFSYSFRYKEIPLTSPSIKEFLFYIRYFFRKGKLQFIKAFPYSTGYDFAENSIIIEKDRIVILLYERERDYRETCIILSKALKIFKYVPVDKNFYKTYLINENEMIVERLPVMIYESRESF